MGYMLEYKDKTRMADPEIGEIMEALHMIKKNACKAIDLYEGIVDTGLYSERMSYKDKMRYHDRYDY